MLPKRVTHTNKGNILKRVHNMLKLDYNSFDINNIHHVVKDHIFPLNRHFPHIPFLDVFHHNSSTKVFFSAQQPNNNQKKGLRIMEHQKNRHIFEP